MMNYSQTKQYIFNNLWMQRGEQSRELNRRLHFTGLSFEQRQAVLTLQMPDGSKVWGIDISHWNLPPVDLKRMKDEFGLSFVIIKGCDGSLNTRYYEEHVAAAKLAGVPWGIYVWLYPNSKVSITAQVAAWKSRFEADPPPLGLHIDAEWTNYAGSPANPNATDLRSAHDQWRNATGLIARTYTAAGYANTYLIGFDWSREPLWIANYGVDEPLLPMGAFIYAIWQFSATLDGHRLDPNGNAELDGNYMNGGTLPEPPPPPTGETMQANIKNFINIRPSPGNTSIDLGDLLQDDVIEYDRKQIVLTGSYTGDWYHITKLTRDSIVSLPTVDWWCWGKNVEEISAPPPPPEPVPSIYVTHDFADVMVVNGQRYTANFTVNDVEYKSDP